MSYYGSLLTKADIDRFIRLNEDKLQYGTDINVCRCVDGKVRVRLTQRERETHTLDLR